MTSWDKISILLLVFAAACTPKLEERNLPQGESGTSDDDGTTIPSSVSTSDSDFLFLQLKGQKRVLYVNLEYPNAVPKLTRNQIISVASQARTHLGELTRGQISMEFEVTNPVMMPKRFEEYSDQHGRVDVYVDAMAGAILQNPLYTTENFDYFVFVSERFWRSAWGGGFASQSGHAAHVENSNLQLMLHELGHSFALEHANRWIPDEGSFTVAGGVHTRRSYDGDELEYGQPSNVMGQILTPPSGVKHYVVWKRFLRGWLTDQNVKTVKTGQYTIQGEESEEDAALMGIEVRISPERSYLVQYQTQYFQNQGPVIVQVYRTRRDSQLIDQTPGSLSQANDWQDAHLPVGDTFVDEVAGVRIRTVSVSSTSVTVDVTYDNEVDNSLPGVHPDQIDNLPWIDFVQPTTGKIKDGMLDIEVSTHDPDFGSNDNFSGIDSVIISVFDPFAPDTQQTTVAGPIQISTPQIVRFDTSLFPNGAHRIRVEARSKDGGKRVVVFPQYFFNP